MPTKKIEEIVDENWKEWLEKYCTDKPYSLCMTDVKYIIHCEILSERKRILKEVEKLPNHLDLRVVEGKKRAKYYHAIALEDVKKIIQDTPRKES